jgi:DNA-binding response OmpR family regulator
MAVISRLRKKLEEDPGTPRYLQTIKGIGYRFNKEV